MLRKFVRGYYKLRYLPRNLFLAQSGIMVEVVAIRRQLLELGRPDHGLGTETEIAGFCDDATKLMMDLSTKLTASTARAEGLERALNRSSERLSRVEESLAGLHAAVLALGAGDERFGSRTLGSLESDRPASEGSAPAGLVRQA